MRRWTIIGTLGFALALALAGAAGCAAEIGDDCGSNADCGTTRICDKSLPGGYCTSTPCEVNSCPAEAVCIEFPDGQTYCMKHCGSNGDCRGGGYKCVEDYGDHPYCGVPF